MIAKPERLCWCGKSDMHPFSADYLVCTSCGTLASQVIHSSEPLAVHDDQRDFYGKEYWLSHQRQDLGLPDIYQRARADLPERGLYWLRTLLSYKQPPAKVLELGGSHGGFVALLRWAGFDAIGTELSPWVVDFARQTFDVPMLLGDIDQQQLPEHSFDVIVLNDVLEHLPDPLETMRHCAALLKPDGILLIQTPSYPDPQTHQELVHAENRFLEMLEADEHLYLFSQRAMRQLFDQLGYGTLHFVPALFAYDMYCVASKQPLAPGSNDQINKNLAASPSGRMIQALLDKDADFQGLARRYADSERDRAARQANNQELAALLTTAEIDRAARLVVIEQQSQQLASVATERDQLHAQLAELQQQAQLRLNQQATLIAEQQQQLDHLNIEAQQLHAERTHLHAEVAQLRSQWASLQPALLALRSSRIYRSARALGRWSWFDQVLTQVLPPVALPDGRRSSHRPVAVPRAKRQLRRIAVDLTPVLPGGENGGAKLMTIALVKHLSKVAPECELILLTAERSHAELAALDAPNVRRICVLHNSQAADAMPAPAVRVRRRLQSGLARVLPPAALSRLRKVYRRIFRKAQTRTNPLKDLSIDLVFCPFTAPLYFDPTVPTVAVVYDLQHFYYPQFFSASERGDRTRHFTELCRMATRLVCISEFVRGTVLENDDIDPARVKTVHIQLPHRLAAPPNDAVANVLKRLGVAQEQFLLYPANFWRHKNHDILLTAFGIYCARHPDSQLKLVCTGTPNARMAELQQAAERMALGDRVIFPGYIADHELAALLQSCYAVMYPSLYEGFGMPLLEAMAFGKPVLCANVASLPEVAGDAALLFDPRKPDELVRAIEQIVASPELAADLVQKGYQRLADLADPAAMARQYLQIFRDAVDDVERFTDGVHGVYPDGWVGEEMTVTFGASTQERQLELTLTAPDWIPYPHVFASIIQNGNGGREAQSIDKGKTVTLLHRLPQTGGYIELLVDPIFQPKALGLNGDERGLGCVCQSCRILSSEEVVELL